MCVCDLLVLLWSCIRAYVTSKFYNAIVYMRMCLFSFIVLFFTCVCDLLALLWSCLRVYVTYLFYCAIVYVCM